MEDNMAQKNDKVEDELIEDPFYSEENIAELKQRISDAKSGLNMNEHELIKDS